ncbi:MAG TPA: hypothetical protein VGL86_24460 [Polyangia bacterium]|jgi:hypothetical protein
MRAVIAFVLLLAACSSTNGGGADLAVPSDFGAAGDLSVRDLASGDDLAADGGRSCLANCSRCAVGVCCGAGCCNAGEWCDNGTCRCGDSPAPACTPGMMCVSNIAAPNECGSICCGNGVACPP